MSEIILVDLPGKGDTPHCWSLNPWKARASLNYKNLPYTTEWIEYPDLASTLSSRGVPKNDGTAASTDYSAPAAKLPDGTWYMDSRKIAEALDKLQPMPKLHMERGDVIDKTQAAVLAVHQHLAPNVMPKIPTGLLNPKSAEYFEETRAKRFGMPLAEFGKSEKAGDVAWENAQPEIKTLAEILKEKPGPFVLGEEISFADFVVGGLFAFYKKVDNKELYERLLKQDEAFFKHVQAVATFFARDT